MATCVYKYRMTVLDAVQLDDFDNVTPAYNPSDKNVWMRVHVQYIGSRGDDTFPDKGGFVDYYIINETDVRCLHNPNQAWCGSWAPDVLIQALKDALKSEDMECEFEITRL